VSASGLAGPAQLGLFVPEARPADVLRDRLRERFGAHALTRASLLPSGGERGGTALDDRKGSRRLRK
jgi:hypothetical protein